MVRPASGTRAGDGCSLMSRGTRARGPAPAHGGRRRPRRPRLRAHCRAGASRCPGPSTPHRPLGSAAVRLLPPRWRPPRPQPRRVAAQPRLVPRALDPRARRPARRSAHAHLPLHLQLVLELQVRQAESRPRLLPADAAVRRVAVHGDVAGRVVSLCDESMGCSTEAGPSYPPRPVMLPAETPSCVPRPRGAARPRRAPGSAGRRWCWLWKPRRGHWRCPRPAEPGLLLLGQSYAGTDAVEGHGPARGDPAPPIAAWAGSRQRTDRAGDNTEKTQRKNGAARRDLLGRSRRVPRARQGAASVCVQLCGRRGPGRLRGVHPTGRRRGTGALKASTTMLPAW